MKLSPHILISVVSLAGLLAGGCASADYGQTSPYHPGPAAGQAVGGAVGVVGGNVTGFGVGATEGVVHGAAAPFNPNYRMVRKWRTETTADGRTIQVPYDVLVDENGRPVNMPAPSGNPSSPRAAKPASHP